MSAALPIAAPSTTPRCERQWKRRLRRMSVRKVINTKHQTPNTNKAPSSKLQTNPARDLMFEVWYLFGVWVLVFGVSSQLAVNQFQHPSHPLGQIHRMRHDDSVTPSSRFNSTSNWPSAVAEA